jgi:type I restriction enzyme S subunit
MSDGLKPYPAYGDSGTEWLGEIPAHWSARQLGRLGRFFKGNGGTKGDEIPEGVPCIRYGDIYTQHQFFVQASRSCVSADRAHEYTPIRYGDVLFAASGETLEEIGKSVVNLIQSRACCGGDVIVFRPSIDVAARFMGYAPDCQRAAFQKSRMGRGITVMHLYGDQLKYMWIALPPLDEQATIADFLDRETEKIDALIAKKQRLLELLRERRSALISHAVTKGLDPDAPMKDSGIKWLGAIPAHWQALPLRRALIGIEQGWSPECESRIVESDEWGILKVGCVNGGSFVDALHKALPTGTSPRSALEVHAGDVLMSRANGSEELVGSVAFAHKCRPRLMLPDLMYRLIPDLSMVDAEFLATALSTPHVRSQIACTLSGSAGLARKLRQSAVRDLVIPVPPVDQQRAIVIHAESAGSRIDELVRSASEAIDRLLEYRSALITAAVTGQIDVRTYRREAS